MFLSFNKEKVKIRHIMRGYRILKKNNSLDLISNLKTSISEVDFQVKSNSYISIQIPGFRLTSNILMQYYFFRVMGPINFNKAVLYAYGLGAGLAFPLPRLLQKRIEDNGVKVKKLLSSIYWFITVLSFWLRGIYVFLRELRSFLFNKKKVFVNEQSNSISFYGLSINNFPINNGKTSYDTVSWFLNQKRSFKVNKIYHDNSKISNFCHDDVNICFRKKLLPNLSKGTSKVKFIFLSLILIFYSLYKAIIGKWEYSLMLGEIIKSIKFHYVDDSLLSNEYIFNNSEWLYRPLWTYLAESRGSKINLYFYSTNVEFFKSTNGYPKPNFRKIASWPNYFVWDQYQKDFIEREINSNSNSKIVGPIWSSDCSSKIIENFSNGVAVFDISQEEIQFISIWLLRAFFK